MTTSPYVLAEADAATGSREPPDDAGAGAVRLLDRPLWGKRELFVRAAPSFEPEVGLYRGLRYQPPPPTAQTAADGPIVGEFIRAAKARQMKVYLQVQAAIPPGYRVQFGGPTEDDQPRLPDGSIPRRRLAKNGSLASPHIRDYLLALLRDLVRVYPEVDGFRIDWPEYPPYLLDDLFLDFSPPAAAAAKRAGIDFEQVRAVVAELYDYVHGQLTDDDLDRWSFGGDATAHASLRALVRRPEIPVWLDFKADLVHDYLAEVRRVLTQLSPAGRRYELVPNTFPPPLTLASGYDFGLNERQVDGASVKLYTMHWPMILNFWAKELLAANAKLSEEAVVRWLVAAMDFPPDEGTTLEPTLRQYSYPEPDAAHPVGNAALRRKMRQAKAETVGASPIYALAHGYGPTDDFRRRLVAAWESADGVWINRYCYLSDEKLAAVGEVCR